MTFGTTRELLPEFDNERKGLGILPATIAGEIDIATSALDAAVAGRASGVPICVVEGFAKGGARIVGRPDLNIKSIADLKGTRVGVARGGAQELLLAAELSKNNLTWSDQPGKDVQIFAFIVVVVAEMIAVNNGLGYRILEAREFFWSDKIIAGMFTIGLLGLAIDSGMNRLNNYLLKWHRGIENN